MVRFVTFITISPPRYALCPPSTKCGTPTASLLLLIVPVDIIPEWAPALPEIGIVPCPWAAFTPGSTVTAVFASAAVIVTSVTAVKAEAPWCRSRPEHYVTWGPVPGWWCVPLFGCGNGSYLLIEAGDFGYQSLVAGIELVLQCVIRHIRSKLSIFIVKALNCFVSILNASSAIFAVVLRTSSCICNTLSRSSMSTPKFRNVCLVYLISRFFGVAMCDRWALSPLSWRCWCLLLGPLGDVAAGDGNAWCVKAWCLPWWCYEKCRWYRLAVD